MLVKGCGNPIVFGRIWWCAVVSKTEYEESVARQVRKALEARPSVTDCLKIGVINYSALARMLGKEFGIKKQEAIVSAIKRYKHAVEAFNYDKRLRKLVAESTIELRPDVAVVTLPKDFDWRPMQELFKIFHVVEGSNATNLVVDERSLANGDKASLPSIAVRRGLGAITVRSTTEFMSTPGSLVYFVSPISLNGINIEEVLSCYTDKIILLRLEDAYKAFSLLNALISETRQEQTKAKTI